MSDKEKKVVDAEAKSKKPEKKKEKKTGKIKEAWRGFNSERKKIVWPTWKQVFKGVLVVLVVVVICAVALGLIDLAFQQGMLNLTKLFS